MDLTLLRSATTVALAAVVFLLLVVRSWVLLSKSGATRRFPNSIMVETAQRFRDRHADPGHEQSAQRVTGWKNQADILLNEDVGAIQAMLTGRCKRCRKRRKPVH